MPLIAELDENLTGGLVEPHRLDVEANARLRPAAGEEGRPDPRRRLELAQDLRGNPHRSAAPPRQPPRAYRGIDIGLQVLLEEEIYRPVRPKETRKIVKVRVLGTGFDQRIAIAKRISTEGKDGRPPGRVYPPANVLDG